MASDLISRAAAIECMKSMAGCDACNNYGGARCRACTWDDAMDIVDELPAVDAAPVVHGRWIDNGKYAKGTISRSCSNCGDIQVHYEKYIPNYCPNCGAKMMGDDNG